MALNLVTALILQDNEVRTFALGPFSNGKYGSVVYLMKDNSAVMPVISIQEGEFDTCKKAIDKLDNVVEAVRELNLPSQKKKLEEIF